MDDAARSLTLKTDSNMNYYKKLKYDINTYAMKFQGLQIFA